MDPGSLYKKTCLYRNTLPVNLPRTPKQGYQFSEDMADQTIAWINSVNATNPNKRWFVYLATPGVHEPHQAPKAYRDKYKGKADNISAVSPDYRAPFTCSGKIQSVTIAVQK